MLRTNLPRAVRALRRRRRWRQADLAIRSGTSREAVSRLERGLMRGVTLGTLEKVTDALGGSLDVIVRWEGAELDRLIDGVHARVQDEVASMLTGLGWEVRAEVSFNHYGDRGRVDVLGYHALARTIVVVEAKSAIGDLQDALGRLDVKTRLGKVIAGECGWTSVGTVVPALIIRDTRAARRAVTDHDALFGRFQVRGRHAVAWVRHPAHPAPSGLLWFTRVPDSHSVTTRRSERPGRVKNRG